MQRVIEPGDYVFVGVAEGFLPDLTVRLQGQLFVALAPISKLLQSYKTTHGKDAVDLMELCGHLTGSTLQDLKKSTPREDPWVNWQFLEAGQIQVGDLQAFLWLGFN